MVRHVDLVGLIIAESSQQRLECYTNKAPDMHWESWTLVASQQSLKRPGVLQAGHQASKEAQSLFP